MTKVSKSLTSRLWLECLGKGATLDNQVLQLAILAFPVIVGGDFNVAVQNREDTAACRLVERQPVDARRPRPCSRTNVLYVAGDLLVKVNCNVSWQSPPMA